MNRNLHLASVFHSKQNVFCPLNTQRINRFHWLLHCCLLLVLNLTGTAGWSQETEKSAEEKRIRTIALVEKSVVSIAKFRPSQSIIQDPGLVKGDQDDPKSPHFIPNEFGTGIIIADELGVKYILTNYHVVRQSQVVQSFHGIPVTRKTKGSFRLHLHFSNRKGSEARILAADPRSDLAVLQIDQASAKELPAISLKPISKFQKGSTVLILGNPYAIARDGSPSVSKGIISNIARLPAPLDYSPFDPTLRKDETIHHLGTLLQLDARLNLGTSGGAVINLNGDLVGITTALAALEGYEKSAGFAIPMSEGTVRVIQSLVKGYEVEYGFLGVTPTNFQFDQRKPLSRQFEQPSAAMVTKVIHQSPASLAGLESGDIILSINNRTVYGRNELMRIIGELGPTYDRKKKVQMKVWRERTRRELQISAALGKWPVQDDEGIIAVAARFPKWSGLTIDFPTARYKYLDQSLSTFHQAVLIREIESQSPLHEKLEPGDLISHLNGKRTRTPAEFYDLLPRTGMVEIQVLDKGTFKLTYETGTWKLTESPE